MQLAFYGHAGRIILLCRGEGGLAMHAQSPKSVKLGLLPISIHCIIINMYLIMDVQPVSKSGCYCV